MDAQTCILTRRSVRRFTQDPVDPALVEQIVSLAAYAPSWKNTQISRYIAIESPQMRKEIAAQFCFPGSNNPGIIRSCPVLIAQTFVRGLSGRGSSGELATDRGEGWSHFDCGVAAQTFCLAAHQLGLGTVIMGAFRRRELEAYLCLPADQELMSLIALGHPDPRFTPVVPPHKTVGQLLSWR